MDSSMHSSRHSSMEAVRQCCVSCLDRGYSLQTFERGQLPFFPQVPSGFFASV